ncbi:MAG: TatD family hydrolase [Candidatus Bipolaricaulaceae bacterium]
MSALRLFDTHVHLDFPQFQGDRSLLLSRMRERGVGAINVGVDLGSSEASLRLARENPHIFGACGIHPHDARTFTPEVEAQLRELVKREAVAVGECGLDFYRNLSPKEDQIRAFRAQLRMAKELDLPVILHERAAWSEFIAILREEGPVKGVVHAFSGDFSRAQEALRLGLYLGIGGPVTYPKNEALRQALAKVPLSRVLLETDSPYLPPQNFRGQRNDPLKVRYVAEALARLLGRPLEDVAETTFSNACKFFGVTP